MRRQPPWVYALLAAAILGGAGPLSAKEDTEDFRTDRRKQPFTVMCNVKLRAGIRKAGQYFGDLAHGEAVRTAEAFRKRIYALDRLDNRPQITLYACRLNHRRALKPYWNVIDQVSMPVFHLPSKVGPKPGDLIWGNYDHPLINRAREVRANAGTTRVLCHIIEVGGRQAGHVYGIRSDRKIAGGEWEWQVFAAIGADFDGVLWWWTETARTRRMEKLLAPHVDELGPASPIGWVTAGEDQPVSALAGETKLFVCLLNPDYMQFDESGDTLVYPALPRKPQGTLTVTPPDGVRLTGGEYLSGIPAPLRPREDGSVNIPYRFHGGGTMLILSLDRSNQREGDVPQPDPGEGDASKQDDAGNTDKPAPDDAGKDASGEPENSPAPSPEPEAAPADAVSRRE